MCVLYFYFVKKKSSDVTFNLKIIDILGSFNLWDKGFTYMLIRTLFHMSVFEHPGALQMVKGFL